MRLIDLTHSVITRLHYEETDPTWDLRLALFRTLMLPCIEAQTIKTFTYYVICNQVHTECIAKLSPIINSIPWPVFPKAMRDGETYNDMISPCQLQTSFDYDDLINPNYIKMLLRELKFCHKPTIISFIPTKFSLIHARRYALKESYGGRQASPFFSLYTPSLNNFQSIYNFNHRSVPKILAPIRLGPSGYCNLVVHNNNWKIRLNPNKGVLS